MYKHSEQSRAKHVIPRILPARGLLASVRRNLEVGEMLCESPIGKGVALVQILRVTEVKAYRMEAASTVSTKIAATNFTSFTFNNYDDSHPKSRRDKQKEEVSERCDCL